MNSSLKIVYMGTPDFAVEPLDKLISNGYNVVGVVTAPDKPAGRGQQLQQSAVKKYALEKGLRILQPEKLKSPEFLEQLKALHADLQIVVAFRMLPEVVWNMPPKGTFNLHASLLPNYRGAAPINWAVINGEKKTGVTTFFLKHEIDTGDILLNAVVDINEDETAGELHDKLMHTGSELVLKTVQLIETGNYAPKKQEEFYANESELKHAPKLFKDTCKLNWSESVDKIQNLIRGLSPYPTAFTELMSAAGETTTLKIFKSIKEKTNHTPPIGTILSDDKTYIKIAASDGYIQLLDLQLAGKKRLKPDEFLRGFKLNAGWKAI